MIAPVAMRLALYVKLSPYSFFRPQVIMNEDASCTRNLSFLSYFNMYNLYPIPPFISSRPSFLVAPRHAIRTLEQLPDPDYVRRKDQTPPSPGAQRRTLEVRIGHADRALVIHRALR